MDIQRLVLAPQCESSTFYTTADWLRHEIGISFCNKEKDENRIYWQFYFGTGVAVLKYDPATRHIRLSRQALEKATFEEKAVFKMLADTMASV